MGTKEIRTKEDVGYFPERRFRLLASKGDRASMGRLAEIMGEVECRCRIFSKLSPDLLLIVFNTIKAVMRDKNLFQELRQKITNGIISESLHQDSSQFTLTKTSADQADGGLSISFDPASVDLQGGASLAKEFSITPQKKSVSLESLEALRKKRPSKESGWVITIEKTGIENCPFYPLSDIDHFPVEALRKAVYAADGPSQGKLGVVVSEVKYSSRIFPELSPDLLLIVFNTIKAVMRDKNLLQELRQKHSPRDCLLPLAEGITYILDALHELMDDQLLLLLESLERKILSQQLKLVENLLKHDMDKGKIFLVDAALLSFPHKEEQMLTMELVELSGVQLQEDGSAVPRDQPFEAMAALFAALYALNFLSGSE
ncbi:hypothetical protein IHE44_0010305 [Lamprotornis superbus]|uniref:Gasdermin PUB domain-containing protein n=1 Tax=Lamprotornis superbus TaxID=245042 RepID=A0A835NJC0_9PASS|nr:hypothetical protein IHE44_0010305 [Lamprotornis superbus]